MSTWPFWRPSTPLSCTVWSSCCAAGTERSRRRRIRGPITSIDRQFAHLLFNFIAAAIKSEWETARLRLRRRAVKLESVPQDVFGRASDVGVISPDDRHLRDPRHLAPRAAASGARSLHADEKAKAPPRPRSDMIWPGRAFCNKASDARPVTLDAYLEASDYTLGALSDLKVGEILRLPSRHLQPCRARRERQPPVSRRHRSGRPSLHASHRRRPHRSRPDRRVPRTRDRGLKPIFELSEV